MSQELTAHSIILKDMDGKIDLNTQKFKLANRKMTELLEEVCSCDHVMSGARLRGVVQGFNLTFVMASPLFPCVCIA